MVAVAVALFVAGAQAATPPRPEPCASARSVTTPCVGLLVPHDQARAALTCLRADLPECVEQAALHAQDLAAELMAAKADARNQRKRADALSALLDAAVTPPAPAPEWWQSSAFVVTVSVVAVGALTAAVLLAVVD